MTKYIITGKFTGRIFVWYQAQTAGPGSLVKFSFEEAELTNEQKDWFINKLEVFENRLPHIFIAIDKETGKPKFIINQEIEELTFDDFYEKYNYKEGKHKAKIAFNKLSAADQMKAYLYISRYKTKLQQQGTAIVYPATYLNQKRWED